MAYRLRPSDGLTVTRLVVAFVAGGLLATTLASPVNLAVNLWSGGIGSVASLTSLALAGVIEELVKILIVGVMSIGLAKKSVRNGLFLGGAVGFGFAAIEDVSYARSTWNTAVADHVSALPAEIFNVISRDVIGIFGHPLFTALLAAAVFGAARNGRLRITARVVLVYLGVAFAHGLFDFAGPFVVQLTRSRGLGDLTFYIVVALEAVVLSLLWRNASKRANALERPSVRAATAGDAPFLAAMLVEVADWNGRRGVTLASAHGDPMTWRYVAGWQGATDFGLIAEGPSGPIGAAWARFFARESPGYGFVDPAVPELTLGVAPGQRGKHVGTALLEALIAFATQRGLPALSLSVEDGNDRARRLYVRFGFATVGRTGNSDTMLLRLPAAARTPAPAAATATAPQSS
jgi:RsiW-degrading membrane proteinase PrsW (M82 family)/GNAT superfamily N-acetyltransferase